MTFKERIQLIRSNPKAFYLKEVNNIHLDLSESIENLLCFLFSGAVFIDVKTIEKLSQLILDHISFDDSPEYQYYYHISKASFYRHHGEIKFALESAEKSNRLSYLVDDPECIIRSLTFMSNIYDGISDYEMALFYAEKSLKLIESYENPSIAADVYTSLGIILLNSGELKRARNAYYKAVDYYKRVSDRNNHLNYCILLLNLGEVCLMLNENEEAEIHFQKGVSIAEKNDYIDFLGSLVIMIAEVFYKKKMYDKAYLYIKNYIDSQETSKLIKRQLEKTHDKDKLKEELSSLYILHRKNKKLNKRLINLYNRIDEKEMVLNERKDQFLQISAALDNGEIKGFFQPKWSYGEQKYIGAEALARWVKEDGSIIYPNDFIPLIEESELINTLSSIIIKQSFEFCKEVTMSINPHFIVSINIAPYQLQHHDVVSMIEKEMLLNGLLADNIEIEITERTFLDKNPRAMNQLYQLKELGIKIALDDFGTGYSSLASLNRIPFDFIKIDRSLIINATSVNNGKKMLGSIINLLHDLNFRVVTEGVEKEEHVQLLKEYDCDIAQGFFYSRAVSTDKLIALLKN